MADSLKTPAEPAKPSAPPPSAAPSAPKRMPPPPPSAWNAAATHYWRVIRHWFNREQIIAFAKTMALVGPLTVLIWIYAEREQGDTYRDVVIPIEVKSRDRNRTVQL